MIKYGQNCLKLYWFDVVVFLLFFMVKMPEKPTSNTEVVLLNDVKSIDIFILFNVSKHYNFRANHLRMRTSSKQSARVYIIIIIYIKTSRQCVQCFAHTHTHTYFLFFCRLLPKNDVAASTFFC